MIRQVRCLAMVLLLLASPAAWAADPVQVPDVHAGMVSVGFASQGSLLARRSHQTLVLDTTNVDTIDVSIAHVGEADVLKVLEAGAQVPVPASAQVVVRRTVPATVAPPSGTATGPAKPGQPGRTSIDVLQWLTALQPGLYFVTAQPIAASPAGGQPLPLGHAATMWLMVSNLGIEAFTGTDGLVAQVRLLSETTPAPGVDVALIARNNRELARVRTDADGVARFGADVASGKGDDAPAALYTYGSDGEFTALRLGEPGLLFPPAAATEAASGQRAWILTDKPDYRRGETIHGLVMIRDAANRAQTGGETVQLTDPAGGLIEEWPVTAAPGGLMTFSLQAPDRPNAHLLLRLVANGKALDGAGGISVEAPGADKDKPPAAAAGSRPVDAPPGIVISPGRRLFQRGELANISIQPPADCDVTLAIVDQNIHAVTRQHVGKEGGVAQLPIPADATGGVYVLATAFTPADEATGKPVQRQFGLQWLDVDVGSMRMGVRLDAPETSVAGKNTAVKIALPDLADKTGSFAIVGTDGTSPSQIDPIRYFFDHQPLGIALHDDYADIVGGASQPALPDIAGDLASADTTAQPALVWSEPQAGGVQPVTVDLPIPAAAKDRTIRLSIVASADGRIGFSETGITAKGQPQRPDDKPHAAAAPNVHAVTIKPDGTLMLKPGQAALISAMPVLAPPLRVGAHGEDGGPLPEDELTPLQNAQVNHEDPETLIYDATVAARLGYAPVAQRLDKQIAALAFSQTLAPDQEYEALGSLYQAGDLPLWAQDWIATAPKPGTALASLCRYGVTHADADAIALPAPPRDDDTENDMSLRQQIMQALVAQRIGGLALKAIAASDVMALSRSVQDFTSLDPRDRLGLRALQRGAADGHPLQPEWVAGPKIEGLPPSGLVRAGAKPLTLVSKDARPLHALVLTNWPGKASQ